MRSRRAAAETAWAAVPLLIGAGFYATNWLGTFPLIEYRNWLAYPFSWHSLSELATNLAFREIPFSRDISLFTVQLTGAACGLDYGCLNGVPIAFLLASQALIYLLARRLVGSPPLAALVALLWIFCRPVMDAASWQATHHDKAAVLFTLLALHAGLSFLQGPAGPARMAASNLVLGGLVVLAYNSKEAAWALVPALIGLGFVAVPGLGLGERLRTQWPRLAVPALYALHQNARYFEHFQEDLPWKIHVTSGDPWSNLRLYLGFSINEPAFTAWALVPFAFLVYAVAVLLRAWARPGRSAPAATRLAGVVVWTAAAWAASVGIVLRLQYPSGFHLVVPSAYFHLMLAAGLGLVLATQAERAAWRRGAVWLLALASGAALLRHSVAAYPEYQALKERSAAFRANLPAFARNVPLAGDGPIYLVADDSRYDAYMYLGEPAARDIYQYIYRDRVPNDAFERRYRDLRRSAFDALARREPGAFYVVFGPDMKLVAIDHGEQALFREP